jgi:hypothetical protein
MPNNKFLKKISSKNPKEDLFGYHAKFVSCSGKDWLLSGSIHSVILHKAIQGTSQRGLAA